VNYNGGKAIPVIGKRSYKGHPEKVGKKGPKDPKNHRLGLTQRRIRSPKAG